MKFRFNKNKIIPDFREYSKLLISVVIAVYLFKGIILTWFPQISNLSDFWSLLFWVALITYFKNLIDINYNRRDWF